MKNSLAVIIFIVAQIVFAQNNIPAAVTKAFSEKFQNATDVKWEKEKNEYEAAFMINGVKVSANFSLDGKWLETETTISEKELPEAVVKAFKEKFPKNEIKAAAKIESPKKVSYEIEYISGKKTKEVEFDANGSIMK